MYKMNKSNKRKRMEEEEEEEDDDMDLPISHLLKHLKSDVYMIDNHLYFKTEVSRDTVEKLNKELILYNRKYDMLKEIHKGYDITPKPIYSNFACSITLH